VVNATATVAAPEASAVELDRHAFGFVWIVGRTVLSASGRTLLAAQFCKNRHIYYRHGIRYFGLLAPPWGLC
jgi:hypothetical protein